MMRGTSTFWTIVGIAATLFLYFGFQAKSDANISHVAVKYDEEGNSYYWVMLWNSGSEDAEDIEIYYALYRYPEETGDNKHPYKMPKPPVYGKFDFDKYRGAKSIAPGDYGRYGFTASLPFKPLYIEFCVSQSGGSPLKKVWYHLIHTTVAGGPSLPPGPEGIDTSFPGWTPRYEKFVKPFWSKMPCDLKADPGIYYLFGLPTDLNDTHRRNYPFVRP